MTFRAKVLPAGNIEAVDALLLRPDGRLNVVAASQLREFPLALLQVWCVKRGVYQIPTRELLEWLATRIAGRSAIEICAGNGAIGRELGIPVTDSWMQARPEIAVYYRALRQEPIIPPDDVVKVDANRAVRRYRPDVVIGSWVTQLYQPGDSEASIDGVDEIAIVRKVAEYIHIGNDGPHGRKRILNRKHEEFRFDWLISRAIDQTGNRIDVWTRGR